MSSHFDSERIGTTDVRAVNVRRVRIPVGIISLYICSYIKVVVYELVTSYNRQLNALFRQREIPPEGGRETRVVKLTSTRNLHAAKHSFFSCRRR